MTKPLSDEVKAMRKKARKPPKPPDLGKDLVNMMYGFGDSARPDAESVELVERLVTQHVDALLGEAQAVARIRQCPVDAPCLLYAVRHERAKFDRARRLLEMKDVIREAKKKGAPDEEADAEGDVD